MKSPSIRRDLVIRCGIGVGTLLCLLFLAVYFLVRQSLYKGIDHSIRQTAALLSNEVELEDEHVTFEWKEGLGSNDMIVLEGLFQFWDDNSGKTTRSPALKSHDLPKFRGKDGEPAIETIILPNGNRGRAIGLLVHPFVLPEELAHMRERGRIIDPKSLPHTLVVAGNLEPIDRTLSQLRYALISGGILTLALGFTLIDHVITLSLRPIDILTRQMRDRSEHELDNTLTLPGGLPAELTGLAGNFDSLLARVANVRQREKDFIRHAAHELRTPIAGLRATTELALSKPRDAPSYAAHLESCRKSAENLGELVQRLTALSRIGQPGTAPTHPETLNPRELLDHCLHTFTPIAADRSIEISCGMPEHDTTVTADRALFLIVLNNLLDNATCYAPDNSLIRIRCERIENHLIITVSNPAPDLTVDPDRLFEPLFRSETDARSSSGTQHLGIGLTLSRDAARAMGATLNARRTDDGWIEFAFSLPSSED